MALTGTRAAASKQYPDLFHVIPHRRESTRSYVEDVGIEYAAFHSF